MTKRSHYAFFGLQGEGGFGGRPMTDDIIDPIRDTTDAGSRLDDKYVAAIA